MIIGEDYPVIEFNLFGLDLVEPNAFIGDFILFSVSIILAFIIRKKYTKNTFFHSWYIFFLIFGFSFLFGGIGHTFYNYLGLFGKYPSWYLGMIAVFFIEKAMISIHPSQFFQRNARIFSVVKLLLAVVAETLVFLFADLEQDVSIGLKVPSINTFIGLVFSLGYLGYVYTKIYTKGFNYHIISVFVLIPTAIVQTLKISFAQWFDRNDISHIFLLTALILYFLGVKAYSLSSNSKVT